MTYCQTNLGKPLVSCPIHYGGAAARNENGKIERHRLAGLVPKTV